jgi:hypothetical protein
MSKRIIEFTCGDPKSNQQTASKVECSITINNNDKDKKAKRGSVFRGINGAEVFDSEYVAETEEIEVVDEQPIKQQPSITAFNSRVNVPVKQMQRAVPPSTERFVMVSRQPVITADEIEANVEFHKKLNEILIKMLTEHDMQLIANIVDRTGKIILGANDFCEVVAAMLSTVDNPLEAGDINITLQEEITAKCFKVSVSPFKHVTGIKINKQDFHTVQNEAYNVLRDVYKISTDIVYVPVIKA